MSDAGSGAPAAAAAAPAPDGGAEPTTSLAAALWAPPWRYAAGALVLVVALVHLANLGTAPPGLYNDEAAIGYDAWAIAHHGVDQHGATFPLFFESFGEYKNPLYIYLLAPLTWFLPLTPYVERLPAALCGLVICFLLAGIGWRLTRSRAVALLAFATAGFEPWLVVESRVGFEVVTMTACMVGALWALSRARTPLGYLGAGVLVALSVLGYTSARLFGLLFAGMIGIAYLLGQRRRPAGIWLGAVPIAAVYALLYGWSQRHPEALTGRFSVVGIGFDHPPLITLLNRLAGNWIDYFSPPFLWTHGDANPRHATGFGGMLLVVTLPALVVGVVSCVRRRDEPLRRLALLGLIVGPVPAALTAEGTPHAIRSAPMLPFILLLTVFGWAEMAPFLASRRAWAAGLAAAAAIEVGGFAYDVETQWPNRALTLFDAGEGPAIAYAASVAGGHQVFLSDSLDVPWIQAYFYLLPDPGAVAVRGPAALGMQVVDPGGLEAASQPGDVLVLSPGDPVPGTALLLHQETVTIRHPLTQVYQPDDVEVVLVRVYRR